MDGIFFVNKTQVKSYIDYVSYLNEQYEKKKILTKKANQKIADNLMQQAEQAATARGKLTFTKGPDLQATKINTGRAKNNLKPDTNATGAHSVFKLDPKTNKVTNYKTYFPNPKNPSGFDEILGYDGVGKPHMNKATGESLMPHVHDKTVPGKVRAPYPNEIPK